MHGGCGESTGLEAGGLRVSLWPCPLWGLTLLVWASVSPAVNRDKTRFSKDLLIF